MQDDNEIITDFPWTNPPANCAIAITGKAFNYLVHNPLKQHILQRILIKAQIYARMSPDDKATLVDRLQILCETEVGMCGDGANDCGALKTADMGISLSEAEASIAAPFTSQIQDISSVIILLKEGRCALVTSFQVFKYIELYALIQFSSVIILYTIGGALSNWQYLYSDLIISIPFILFMGQTGPYKKLSTYLPPGSLLSLPVLISVVFAILIQFFGQLFIFLYIRTQEFYIERPPKPFNRFDPIDDVQNYEGTACFQVSMFMYIIMGIAFSRSKPFRKAIYTNWLFSLDIICVAILSVYLTFTQYPWFLNLM